MSKISESRFFTPNSERCRQRDPINLTIGQSEQILSSLRDFLSNFFSNEELDQLINIKTKELSLEKRKNNVGDFLVGLGVPRELIRKIKKKCQLNLVDVDQFNQMTKGIDDKQEYRNRIINRRGLSLPEIIFWLAVSDLSEDNLLLLREFIENGGIVQINSALEPTAEYLEQVKNQQAPSLNEKIISVLQKRNNGDPQLKQASHKFISLNFVKKGELSEKEGQLQTQLSKLTDKYEETYARIVLAREILRENMDQVRVSLLSMGAIAGIFHILDSIVKNKASMDYYIVFNAIIKGTTHFIANFIDFFSQYKLFLKGNNFIEQIEDLIIDKIGFKGGGIFLIGLLFDFLSEAVKNNMLGSFIFGLESLIGALFTSLYGLEQVGKEINRSNQVNNSSFKADESNRNVESTSQLRLEEQNVKIDKSKVRFPLRDKVYVLFENPAVLSMELAAFLTFLLSIGLLGFADQFHNPVAVVGVGGLSEPLLAALFSKIFEKYYIEKMKKELFLVKNKD